MHSDDDDYGRTWRVTSGGGSRVFLDRDHDTPENAAAWKAGIASAKAGDSAGMLLALEKAEGSALSLNARGKPARNPCSRAILALRSDPLAWRRMRDDCRGRFHGKDAQAEDWTPTSTSMLEYMWAANPEALAGAAKLWREKHATTEKYWSSPFIGRPWEGRPQLFDCLDRAVGRHFDPDGPSRNRGIMDKPEPKPAPGDPAERAALERILVEAARACVEQLARREAGSARRREAGSKVYSRESGSEWGLDWHGAKLPLDPAAPRLREPADSMEREFMEETEASRPKRTAVETAAKEAMLDALAAGPDAADLACRKIMTAANWPCVGHAPATAALALWSEAFPESPQGLPLDRWDWMAPARLLHLCEEAGASDASLARFLAGAGSHWSAPAKLNHQGRIGLGSPPWDGNAPYADASKARDARGLDLWRLLDWALLIQPEAARAACVLGAKLAPGFEAAIQAQAAKRPDEAAWTTALVWAEACGIADISRPSKPLPSKRPPSL